MTDYKGRDFLLKVGTWAAGTTVADCKTHSLKIANTQVDITNKSSSGFVTYLENAGTKALSITFGGLVSNDAGFETFQGYANSNTINAMSVGGLGDGDSVDGSFCITSFQLDGNYNDAQAFTATIESSGAWTFNQV